ncbi:DUF6867 family protein [Chthonobacter albigriseus]|uniref:DUF6867 family protein n=1 Tax=Chthonobacter albigriseus TaxID=1683161 RepID=UPI0015EFAD55|nr:hypothetical protein [Chthonobacter albigriseus]
MQGILYEEHSIVLFALITVLIGGWAAWMTGRACAKTWRGGLILFIYILFLGMAVRFIHFAVFGGTLLSLHYYIVDTVILEIIAFVGFRYTRTRQMVRQYFWLYEQSGPISWRSKG